MAEKERTYIFHLKRGDGNPLFLHPFNRPERLLRALTRTQVVGRYGAEPKVEGLTMFRNELYRIVEAAVSDWIAEARFIPRFLLSAGAFLVAYFFASYVIRDPIPVLDEVAIGLGAAVAANLFLGKRYRASREAERMRVQLRAAVDRISFVESGFVRRVEAALHDQENQEIDEIVRRIVSPAAVDLNEQEGEEARRLVELLEARFNIKRMRRDERVLRRFVEHHGGTAQRQHLRRWIDSHKLDAPLYALYKSFKGTVQARR